MATITQAAFRIAVWTAAADLNEAGNGSDGKYAPSTIDQVAIDEAQDLAAMPFSEELLAPWSASGDIQTGTDSKIAFGSIVYGKILYVLAYAKRFYLDGPTPPERNDISEPRYHVSRKGKDFYLWGPDDFASMTTGLTLVYIPLMTNAIVYDTAVPLLKALIFGTAARVCLPTESPLAGNLLKLRNQEIAPYLPQPKANA